MSTRKKEQVLKIGPTIKRLREGAGMTQRELGAKSGLTFSYIALLEQGKNNPTLDTLKALAEALGTHAYILVWHAEVQKLDQDTDQDIQQAIDRTQRGRVIHARPLES